MKRLFLLLLPLVLLAVGRAAETAKPPAEATDGFVAPSVMKGDPMDWSPTKGPPALRAALGPKIYARRFKAERAKIDLDALRDPSRPTSGELVTSIYPHSQAVALGIKAGDILISVDGMPLGSGPGEATINDTRNSESQQLAYWSHGQGRKTVRIHKGLVGVGYFDGWRPDEAYARSADLDPRWDDAMLVAAAASANEPNLAETALFHAQQAGYHGRLVAPLAARIAFEQARYDDALRIGWPLWQNHMMGRYLIDTMYFSAVFDFKLEQAMELAKKVPGAIGDQPDLAPIIQAYRAMPKSLAEDPVSRLPTLTRRRITKFGLAVLGGKAMDKKMTQWALPMMNHGKPIVLTGNIQPRHFWSMTLSPGVANVALTVRFDVRDTRKNRSEFESGLLIGLDDLSVPEAKQTTASGVRVNLLISGHTRVEGFGLSTEPDPPPSPRALFNLMYRHSRSARNIQGSLRR